MKEALAALVGCLIGIVGIGIWLGFVPLPLPSAVVRRQAEEPPPAPIIGPSAKPETAVQPIPPREIEPAPAPLIPTAKPAVAAAPAHRGGAGTCGEYRDGKLTVLPCSQMKNPADWLDKGSGVKDAKPAPQEANATQ